MQSACSVHHPYSFFISYFAVILIFLLFLPSLHLTFLCAPEPISAFRHSSLSLMPSHTRYVCYFYLIVYLLRAYYTLAYFHANSLFSVPQPPYFPVDSRAHDSAHFFNYPCAAARALVHIHTYRISLSLACRKTVVVIVVANSDTAGSRGRRPLLSHSCVLRGGRCVISFSVSPCAAYVCLSRPLSLSFLFAVARFPLLFSLSLSLSLSRVLIVCQRRARV